MSLHALRDALVSLSARLPVVAEEPTGREVVLIRPDHLGDLLFLGPGIRRLRRALPGARVTLLVGPWGAEVAARLDGVDEVVTLPFPGFARRPKASPWAPYRLLLDAAAELRCRRAAAAVILRDDHWWGALLAHLAGIPVRVGSDHPTVRPHLTHVAPGLARHWVQRNAAMLDAAARALGGEPPAEPVTPLSAPLAWRSRPEDDAAATRLLAERGVPERYAVVHPGAGAAVKLWPAERWAAVAGALAARGLGVVLTGGVDEAALVERIRCRAGAGTISLAGATDVGTLAALFTGARLVAGVDSGPLHLAVAVGAPTVHLYGPSSVAAFGPWGPPERHRVVSARLRCPRCGDLSPDRPEGAGCMVAIDAREVMGAIAGLLAHG